MAQVTTWSVAETRERMADPSVQIVDIRDVRELQAEGTVPGSYHAPRCMLEFWVDPESPYYKPELDDGRRLVLYCGSAWRSALATATLTEMGREDVTHLAGGFSAWQAAGHPLEAVGRREAANRPPAPGV